MSRSQKAADNMKKHYDRKCNPVPGYKVGDKVWLDGSNIETNKPSKKLDDKHYGPYVIESLIPHKCSVFKVTKFHAVATSGFQHHEK